MTRSPALPTSPTLFHGSRVALALFLGILLVGYGTPGASAQEASLPTLSAPVTGGERAGPFGGYGAAGLPPGMVEEERFVSGTAVAYQRVGTWSGEGVWEVEVEESAPYAVRLLVRRPSDPARFNGTVVVEWLNVTSQSEGAADYTHMEDELLRGGYAWVGVGAQAVGIHAPGVGLRAWDPVRYAPLEHPGDRFSYDIFSQVAQALREGTGPEGPLPGFEVEHLVATGRSQSGFRLVTYINAVHPRTRLFDGYFVHSRGANAAGLRAEGLAPDTPAPVPPGAHIRTDTDVPVLDVQAEGDMTTLRSHLTRQGPSDRYRRWEIAGAAHAEVPRWVASEPPALPTGPGCALPVNVAPHDAVVKAGLHALVRWVREGVAPPHSPEIELVDPAAPDPVARDAHGNALGGIRIPHVEAPTATVDGRTNQVGNATPGAQNFCFLFGTTRLFDAAALRELYPTHEAFVERYVAAIDALERDGYLLPPEAAEARRAAEASNVGR